MRFSEVLRFDATLITQHAPQCHCVHPRKAMREGSRSPRFTFHICSGESGPDALGPIVVPHGPTLEPLQNRSPLNR